ncbi:MAG: hypothetical protein WEC75_02065 [Dehalococcoidia bacterium]
MEFTGHGAARKAWNYPLFDAIFNRRSRRMALGAEIPGGATKYKSDKPPMPLDEVEEAMLAQAGTGISGMNLSDLPYTYPDGKSASGNTMLQFTGRTWSSPCGSHSTELIYFNDSGSYVVSLKDVCAEKVQQFETEGDREKILTQFRENRIRILDHRPEHPRAYPAMLSFNFWDSNIEGSTVFLPVINNTWQYINGLLLVCGWADGGAYILDDLNGGRPAGCERWVKEGLLDENRPLALSGGGFGQEVEPAFILHNIVLAEQAMGLGGWIHAAVNPAFMAEALGFRAETPAGSMMPNPVGIDGVLEGYCPPYYKNMDAAVDAVVEAKFGAQGIYTMDARREAPFLDRNEFVAGVPRYSEKLVQCVKDICNYIYETFGRFPAPPLATMGISPYWAQAHHLDLDFYDRFYGKSAYTQTQAEHYELWHGSARPWEKLKERQLARVNA